MSDTDTTSDMLTCVVELETSILADKLNKDNINNLVELSSCQDGEVRFAAQQGLGRVFLNFINSGFLNPRKTSLVSGEESTPEAQFQAWILDVYFSYRSKLAISICQSNDHITELHDTSIQLVRSESAVTGNLSSFLIDRIVSRLISKKPDTEPLFQLFENDLQFCDVIYSSLCTLRRSLTPGKGSSYLPENILQLMMSIQRHLPQKTTDYKYIVSGNSNMKHLEKKDILKLISKIWAQFLSYDMTHDTQMLVLRVMDTEILPNLTEPCLLLDFLTRSLDAGGELGILSLKSLVILIHQHKLEYPHLYTKIYSLLSPELTYSKDYGDFLALFDMVTTSTHLPQYLVAAYMKRLAIIAVQAPAHSIRPILVIIYNLVTRHPNCYVMLYRPDGVYPDKDPYLPEELDPMKSNAIDSCLWELGTLKHHYCPETAGLISKLFKPPLKKKERSIASYIGDNDKTLEKLIKRCQADFENDKFSFIKSVKDSPFPEEKSSN